MRTDSMKHQPRTKQGDPAAFALIELLVVISVIAILLAVLVPALRRAKESGRSLACYSNLRQLGVASNLYAEDNDARFPSFRQWLYERPRVGDLTTGQLYPYLNSTDVYQCPTDRVELAAHSVPTNPGFKIGRPGNFSDVRDYSYAMNCAICHDTQVASFVAPSKTLLYMEGDLRPTDYSGQVGPSNNTTRSLALRHNEQGHLLLADLHIERLNTEEFDRVSATKRFWLPSDRRFGPPWDNMFQGMR